MNLGHLPTREAERNPGHKSNPFCVWGLCLIRVSWWRKAGLGLSEEGDGRGAPGVFARFLAEQHLSPGNSVAWCQLTVPCAQAVKTARQGARAQPGRTLPPSVGQDEAAPSQKSAGEKVVQVKTGPSQCLAESGWRGTCEKDREGGSIQQSRQSRHLLGQQF